MVAFRNGRFAFRPKGLRRLRAKLSGWAARFAGTPFVARREGAVAIEFALIAIPFFLIVMATVQTAVVYMAQQELETVTEQASRYILTDQATSDTQSQFAQVVCNQVVALFNCSNLMIDVETAASFSSANTSAPTLNFNSSGQVTNSWQFTPGNAGDIVVVRVMYQWPIFLRPFGYNLANLSNGNRLLMATAVFRNEPL